MSRNRIQVHQIDLLERVNDFNARRIKKNAESIDRARMDRLKYRKLYQLENYKRMNMSVYSVR